MDSTQFNRNAWNNIATSEHGWFEPVSRETIEQARAGIFSVRLTACKSIPNSWIGPVTGRKILCLGGGGGHQGPVMAAAGGDVTVVDISENQLEIDQRIAKEYELSLNTLRADMARLDGIESGTFELIINPCSVNFCPDVKPVWREAARVLKSGGILIAGMIQPVNFLFDPAKMEKGEFDLRFRIPYSDLDLPVDEREVTLGPERPIDFGHSLTDLIGGQLDAGFQLTDFMEDGWGGDEPLSQRIATFCATRALKQR